MQLFLLQWVDGGGGVEDKEEGRKWIWCSRRVAVNRRCYFDFSTADLRRITAHPLFVKMSSNAILLLLFIQEGRNGKPEFLSFL
ncbi:hypothetical protein P8452_28424 [Trifolium repens]|nr:hypothetical protein P8452_28424 [Trifolium repens]